MTLEEISILREKLEKWKKDLSPEDIKSIINQIENPEIQFIAKKILLEKDRNGKM